MCFFLGYASYQKGYRCYHPPSKRMFVTMDVVFHEESMYFSSEPELQGEHLEEVQALDYDFLISIDGELSKPGNNLNGNEKECPKLGNENASELDWSGINLDHSGDEHDEDLENEVVDQPPSEYLAPLETDTPNQSPAEDGPDVMSEPPRKQLPQRQTRGIPKPTYEPELSSKVKYLMSHYVSKHRLFESNKSFINQLSTASIPNSVQEALADPRWKAAMNEVMKSLQKNETWELVDRPLGKKPVGCRWVYTVKHKADGTIEHFKARLVAKGYTQRYGIDYINTFALVSKINIVRVLLSLATSLDWPLQPFDVKNTFLHGEFFEEMYMDFPLGCMIPEVHCRKVCKLKKSLYGLKQSPRAWFGRFTKSMKSFGYHQSNSDHTLFLKKQHGKITALIVYVDDMVVIGNDPDERKALQSYLSSEF